MLKIKVFLDSCLCYPIPEAVTPSHKRDRIKISDHVFRGSKRYSSISFATLAKG